MIALSLLVSLTSSGINSNDTRMMAQPAISANHIAFIYAEDLWIANADGTQPRRLTVDEGIESNPFFSPDGKLIAFNAQYDGNTDVYTIPVEGGVPVKTDLASGKRSCERFYSGRKECSFCLTAIFLH